MLPMPPSVIATSALTDMETPTIGLIVKIGPSKPPAAAANIVAKIILNRKILPKLTPINIAVSVSLATARMALPSFVFEMKRRIAPIEAKDIKETINLSFER